MPWWYLATLLAANLTLLLPPASPLRVAGAFLFISLLPGLPWAARFWPHPSPLLRWIIAAALSYSFTTLTTLLWHYLPGPVQMWHILLALNLLAILPLIMNRLLKTPHAPLSTFPPIAGQTADHRPPVDHSQLTIVHSPLTIVSLRTSTPLLLILLIALFLRTLNLNYSEFQGDEALAMITAAEALEGHEDALFLRSKGPAEVLLPMALWRLTGVINESIARLPFTTASLLAIVTIYLVGRKLGGERTGCLAAGFFAFNGFMVAFGRIVQYQALVVWFSTLAFLLMLEWSETRRLSLALLAGLCLGLGLLAHYDAVLVVPALAWILLTGVPANTSRGQGVAFLSGRLAAVGGLITAFLLAALPFYLPFSLDPQANRTGDYVGARIGNELRNNLPDFFHFNTFYSSFYYLVLSGLLVLGLLTWLLWQTRQSRWPGIILAGLVLAVVFKPNLLAWDSLDLSVLPFALLLAGAFIALFMHSFLVSKTESLPHPPLLPLLLWLAIPFLGYNFVVALGLTHIYTIVPAWSLLAGLGWHIFFDRKLEQEKDSPRLTLPRLTSNGLLIGLILLSTFFLWNAFIRHDVEYWQDYPAGNLPLYWTPYKQLPPAGFFGFAHRTGWKAVGQKIVAGELAGDYGSNEEPDVTTWYTRGAPRACDPQPEFYFLAGDLIDQVDVSPDLLVSTYGQIGQVTLPNQKQMRIMQLRPTTLTLGELSDSALAGEFDQTASPAAFARSARGSVPVEANFSHLIRLIGYDLDTRRAQPGGRIPVTLYWQAQASIPASYQVFTHLESEQGPVAQADGVPVCWTYPTNLWRPGQIIADQHTIQLSSGVPPGDYPLQVGLYLADTFTRLDVLDEAGNPASNSIMLTQVRITASE
ncbi:MAG: glycosyltransferase family 39 protein [Anaerolineales bacterium]|nr:glycosyltransferase family 39 protein [Anaerolineales bacterium]